MNRIINGFPFNTTGLSAFMGAPLSWFKDLEDLFFPEHCTGCGAILTQPLLPACQACIASLPRTDFQKMAQNPVEKIFRGRIPVKSAASIFYFTRNSPLQSMIHHLKYKDRPDLGKFLGRLMGHALAQTACPCNIDALVPLPLYPDRQKERGYNQSEMLALGISEVLGIPVVPEAIQRVRKTNSQTRKNRTERWENMEQAFAPVISLWQDLQEVMLIDDVITTGATLEACGQSILNHTGASLHICTLAYADQ